MVRIMALSWGSVRVATRLSSMEADVDSRRDSNVGVPVRTVELPIRAGRGSEESVAAGGGQAGDGVDAALEADGAGVDGAGVDVGGAGPKLLHVIKKRPGRSRAARTRSRPTAPRARPAELAAYKQLAPPRNHSSLILKIYD